MASRAGKLSLLPLAALALAAFGAAAWVGADSVPLAPDAAIREALCRRIALGVTEGRQGLVSSAWFAPLPTLLRLPFVFLLPDSLAGLPSRLVSLAFGLLTLAALGRTAWRWAGSLPAALIVLGLAAHPAFLTACLDGGDATTAACFTLLCAASWVRWALEDRLTHLVLMSLAAALLVLTRFELLAWAAVGFAFVLLHEAAAPRLPAQRQALLILGLLPWAYGVSLWVLGNWLIMGDALYFLRGIPFIQAAPDRPFPSPAFPIANPGWWMPLLFPVFLLPATLLKREFAGLALALLAGAAIALAAGLDTLACLWDAPVILLPGLTLAFLALARLAGQAPVRRPSIRLAVAAFAPLLPLVLLAMQPAAWPSGPAGLPPLREENRALLAGIREKIADRLPFARVYVCGYDSFPALDSGADPLFLRELDFDFQRARREYKGHALFLLVPKPDGRNASESIHRKFPGIYAAGFANTLYTGDWDRWRLFELVDKPREEEP